MPKEHRASKGGKEFCRTLGQGLAIGAANVVPGLSGATIAFIIGVFERIVAAIASFDLDALRLLVRGKFSVLARRLDLRFLLPLVLGMGLGLVALAKLFDWLFATYAVYLWAFFLGLVLVSVLVVGRGVGRWSAAALLCLLLGAASALALAQLPPAVENASFGYLLLCGAVAMSSMMLPGVSGSLVLLLLGNYPLLLRGVSQLQLAVLLPFALGAGIGAIGFSQLLRWLLLRYRSQTTALLCGFVAASLGSLWPWKSMPGESASLLLPQLDGQLALALLCLLLGAASVLVMDRQAARRAAG